MVETAVVDDLASAPFAVVVAVLLDLEPLVAHLRVGVASLTFLRQARVGPLWLASMALLSPEVRVYHSNNRQRHLPREHWD